MWDRAGLVTPPQKLPDSDGMTTWCPLHADAHETAVCPIALLHEALRTYGEVTIRLKDLGPDELGRTWWTDSMIDLHRDQDPGEWRATLQHELIHLLRGPADDEDAEEEIVERLAQVLLFPGSDHDDDETLRIKRRVWRTKDTANLEALPLAHAEPATQTTSPGAVAERYEEPPDLPAIPDPRHALPAEQLPGSSAWVAARARRFARINHDTCTHNHNLR